MPSFRIESKIDEDQPNPIVEPDKLKDNYIPHEFPHREDFQSFLLENIFEPMVKQNQNPNHAIAVGDSGTGKTAVTKAAIKEFRESPTEVINEVRIIYINCSQNNSYQKVMESIANKIDCEWKNGVKKGDNLQRLMRSLSNNFSQHLIVLDELDFLYKKRSGRNYVEEVIYDLSRPHEVFEEEWDSNITLLGVSNDAVVTEDDVLGEDNKSAFNPLTYTLYPYNAEEIFDILKVRYDEAFKEKVIGRSGLKFLAGKLKKNFNSDIRHGIKILEKIGTMDVEGKADKDIIEAAISKYQSQRLQKYFTGKSKHEVILYDAVFSLIEEEGEPTISKVNTYYFNTCKEMAIECKTEGSEPSRWVYNKVKDLEEAELITKRINYDEQGRPNILQCEEDLSTIQSILKRIIDRRGLNMYDKANLSSIDDGISEIEKDAEEKMEELGLK